MSPDERPPRPGWSLLKRSALASVLIVVLAAAATATAGLEKVSTVAHGLFGRGQQIVAPSGVIAPSYAGAPQTFLLIGSDKRPKARSLFDRSDPPHSDTLLLAHLDPSRGQTSVMSIPRDLLVSIRAPNGQNLYPQKINAAYTVGSFQKGTDPGASAAAVTVEHLLGIKLNGIVDVTFGGFIDVVDSLGCVYVNVDHRYFNQNLGTSATNYSNINLQPGYQKLCYDSALGYVRYRHLDSDFVRVARQQDFIRNLREQISVSNLLGQIDSVSRAVGKAITTTFRPSVSETLKLAELLAFSQSRPLRQVPFRHSPATTIINGVDYVSATPQDIQATVADFLTGTGQATLPKPAPIVHHASHRRGRRSTSATPGLPAGLVPTSLSSENQAITGATRMPFPVLYPRLQTAPAVPQGFRSYTLTGTDHRRHHAFVEVWQQDIQGGFYDVQGTDWLDPPIISHPEATKHIGGRTYMLINDGSHVHLIAWKQNGVLYWVNNTLLESLSNAQMLALAESVRPLH